jgi:hypothetical protein
MYTNADAIMNDKAVDWLSRPLYRAVGNRAKVLANVWGNSSVDNGTRFWIAVSLGVDRSHQVKACLGMFVCDNV